MPCPADVTAESLESYVREVYGPPLDVVRTTTEQFDRIMIGWLYPLELLREVFDPEAKPGWELWVIPMVRHEAGGYYSMFVDIAEKRERNQRSH